MFLETDWMSTEVSSAETDDEQAQIAYQAKIAKVAGLLYADTQDGLGAWKVIKPAW